MSTPLEQLQYGFDRDSRRTWRQRATTQGWDNAYAYDSLSQVICDDRGDLNQAHNAIAGIPANGARWQYDETGNWHGYQTLADGAATLNQVRTHDKGNRLMEVSDAAAMRTDRAGRMLETVPGPGGDWSKGYEITWDAWSRITAVAGVEGETITPVAAYAYDGLTRRITRYTDEEDVTLHSYYNDAWRPVEERKDSETTGALSYLWGSRHRDDLVRRDRAVGGTTLNETRYVLMDYFSPAAITDEVGEVTERYQYSAFGLRKILNPDFTVRSTSECAMEFSFQGQFEDVETGWLNYGYRYYLPAVGRWACKDPIGIRGGLNIYEMAANNPTNEVDYLGLTSMIPLKVMDYQPDELDHFDQHKEGDFLGENKWFERNYPNLIAEARTFFIGQVNIWVVQNCRKSPYTIPLAKSIQPQGSGVKVDMSTSTWPETKFGDKGQSDWWSTKVLGQFTFNVTVPINIEYETPDKDGNIRFRWKTTFQVGDTLGYQSHDDVNAFMRRLAPSVNVVRTRWDLEGLGACCPNKE